MSTTDIAARVLVQSFAIPFPLLYTHALIQIHISTKWQVYWALDTSQSSHIKSLT